MVIKPVHIGTTTDGHALVELDGEALCDIVCALRNSIPVNEEAGNKYITADEKTLLAFFRDILNAQE